MCKRRRNAGIERHRPWRDHCRAQAHLCPQEANVLKILSVVFVFALITSVPLPALAQGTGTTAQGVLGGSTNPGGTTSTSESASTGGTSSSGGTQATGNVSSGTSSAGTGAATTGTGTT